VKGTSIQALAWLACTLALGCCSIARADSALLLPPAGDPELSALQQSAQHGLNAALREAGLDVRAPKSRARTRNADEACEQIACASTLLTDLHADIAVGLAVWRGEHDAEVNVTIVDSAGTRYPGRALVGADAANAARAAMLEAQALRMLGPGPWVSIAGDPAGASVWIDGRFVGSLPYRAGITPGDHQLELRADGHAAKTIDLKVPLEPTALEALEVKLEKGTAVPADQNEPAMSTAVPADQQAGSPPAAEPLADRAPTRSSPSPWNFIVGGALIVGGGVIIIADPVRAAVRDGRCADPQCNRVYRFGTRSAAELALGVALAAAGVTMLIWQPLRVTATVGTDRAQLSATMRF
jgi:hypothetical protein